MRRLLVAAALAATCLAAPAGAEIRAVVGYLERIVPPPPVLSNLEEVPEDEGLAGAELGMQDNSTTGRFMKHEYVLEKRIVEEDGDLAAAARELLAQTPFLVVKAPAADLLALADLPEAKEAIIFNAGAADDELRDAQCRANLLHTLPSRAMLADALAQFAVKKRWTRWVMIHGEAEADKALAAAFRKSAAKFRVELLAEKLWAFDADMRRNAAQEVPLFTQDFPDHDILVVADEAGDYARYVMYNSWLPRPVAGSHGLEPAAWSRVVEQHGAVQLQNRFRDLAGRDMRPVDWAAWTAVRAVGEAVTRTKTAEVDHRRSGAVLSLPV